MNGETVSAANLPPIDAPMSFGQILDRTFKLVRVHWKLFVRVALLPAAMFAGMMVVVAGAMLPWILPLIRGTQTQPGPAAFVAITLPICVAQLLAVLISALYLPAAHDAAIAANRGRNTTSDEAYRMAKQRYGRFLWLLILIALYVMIPMLLIVACFAAVGLLAHLLGDSGSPVLALMIPLIGLLYLGYMVYAVLVMLRFSLAFAVCVDEQIPARVALKRSAQLTHGAKGRIFLLFLVVYAILYAVVYAFILVLAAVGGAVVVGAMAMHVEAGTPVFYVLIALGCLVYLAIIAVASIANYVGMIAAAAVIYDDQKLRLSSQAPGTGKEVSPA